jgi:hypothetical protein
MYKIDIKNKKSILILKYQNIKNNKITHYITKQHNVFRYIKMLSM